MILDKFFDFFSNDLGIDLGTANTVIHSKGRGIVLSEPSVVALNLHTREVLAVGIEAKKMLGRTPKDIIAIKPMRHGVIADFEIVQAMIRAFIKRVYNNNIFMRPRIVIGVPSCITEVEKRAVKESAEQAGARSIYLIEESFAAAIGAGLPIEEPYGCMIVDIGGGTTEVSIISLGGMVISNSIRVGGDDFDDALVQYMKKKHSLIIGDRTAEEVKIRIGNAYRLEDKDMNTIELKGRNVSSGLPQVKEMTAKEIRECFQDTLMKILNTVRETLDATPAELAADIGENGIVLTGGGALLKGFPSFIASETGIPVSLACNPLECVVMGTGKYLEHLNKYRRR